MRHTTISPRPLLPRMTEETDALTVSEPDVSAEDLALADALTWQLVRLFRLIERTGSPPGIPALERSQYVLLARLVEGGPARAGSLAEAVHSDPSTVSRQVADLVEHGLVERRIDPVDRRACLLVATAAGLDLFAEARRRKTEHLARLLAGWSVPDRRRLVDLLERFSTDMEQYRQTMAATRPPARTEAPAGGS
jgi:DNA-binding MarR family transcriptional regulator